MPLQQATNASLTKRPNSSSIVESILYVSFNEPQTEDIIPRVLEYNGSVSLKRERCLYKYGRRLKVSRFDRCKQLDFVSVLMNWPDVI